MGYSNIDEEIEVRLNKILRNAIKSLKEDGLTTRDIEMFVKGIMYNLVEDDKELFRELDGPLIENPKTLDELIENATKKYDILKAIEDIEREQSLNIER